MTQERNYDTTGFCSWCGMFGRIRLDADLGRICYQCDAERDFIRNVKKFAEQKGVITI